MEMAHRSDGSARDRNGGGRGQRGFTLIELMMVVAIMALLASVAIPSYNRYLKRSRTVEATQLLDKLATGAQLYFQQELVTAAGSVANQLPSTATQWCPTRAHTWACTNHGGAFPASLMPSFDVEPWNALKFKPEGTTRYRYYWNAQRQHTATTTARGYAEALGDLDCDGVTSRWRLQLLEDAQTRVLRRRGPYIIAGDALE